LHDKKHSLSLKLFWFLNDISDFRKCSICGKVLDKEKYDLKSGKYLSNTLHCSCKCSANDKITIHKRKQTSKHRHDNFTFNNRKKYKETCLKNFGCENVFQSEIIKNKIKNTNLINHNIEHYVNLDKAKQTNLERYGCENVFANTCIKEKIKQTCLERYGVEHYVNLDKTKQTNLEKYGVEYPIQCREVRLKQQTKYDYKNICFDSSPEIALYIYLKDNNIDFEYQPDIRFEYSVNDKTHYYFPDFRIEDKYYEIKGDQFFDDCGRMINPYDRSQDALYESKHQCMKDNNVIILRNNDYQRYLDYVSEKYGNDYLKTFKKY
jgi:hypothetical protein